MKIAVGPARAWIVVGLLWAVAFSCYLTRNLLVTMHGSVEAAIPMTEAQFGLLTSGFLWIYALLNPLGGLLADRFSRSAVIIASLLAWSVVTWLTAYAESFPQLLALRAVMGVSQACFVPAASALVADYHPGSSRSFAMGLFMSGLVTGTTIGGMSGWLAEARHWSTAFSLTGIPSLCFGLLLVFVLRDPPGRPAAGEAGPKPIRFGTALLSVARNPSVLAVLATAMLQNAVSWLVIGWMPTYFRERFKLGQGPAGFSALAYMSITQFLTLFASGVWSDRWSRRHVRARLWVPAIGLGLSAPAFWLAAHTGQMLPTLACLCLWGFAVGCMGSNTMPILCLVTDRRYRATAYGLINSAGAIAGGLAVYGVGAMRDFGVGWAASLNLAGAAAVLCSLCFLLVRTERVQAD